MNGEQQPPELEPDEAERLADELGLVPGDLVALVGGGGKTTLLFGLGRVMATRGPTVLTTTTKMGTERTYGHRTLVAPEDAQLSHTLAESPRNAGGAILVWSSTDERKALGIAPEDVDRWHAAMQPSIIIEADGARRHPFKAPDPHEPVIPHRTTVVVCVIGADALDRVIEDQCHRPLRVAAVAGCSPYERLTPERAARVLVSDRGSRQFVPPAARFAVVITKVDNSNRHLVDALSGLLLSDPHVDIAATVPAFDR